MATKHNPRKDLDSAARPVPEDRASVVPPPDFTKIVSSRGPRAWIFLLVVAAAIGGLVFLVVR